MLINRIEASNFLVFQHEFSADFCPGINLFIGGNGTGKTTLLKRFYGRYNRLINGEKNVKATVYLNENLFEMSK